MPGLTIGTNLRQIDARHQSSAALDRSDKKPPDRTDAKILDVLQAEGRITIQSLSERVSLSPSACLARVRQMEAAGIITGYHAHIAREKLRPTLVIHAEVTLARHNPDAFDRFESAIGTIPQIVEAAQVSGPFDYLLKVVVGDVEAWRKLAARLQDGSSGVEKVTSHIQLKSAKRFDGLPLE
jgi:DNA-binding Lrp family transcriptional regulator